MFTKGPLFDTLPPGLQRQIKEANAKYTSSEVKNLDKECAKLVIDLRVKQKKFDTDVKKNLNELDTAITRVENQRGALVTCTTQIYGHEKIIAKHMTALKKAHAAGDVKKCKTIEDKIKKQTESYHKTMKEASKISSSIETDLADAVKLIEAFKTVANMIPVSRMVIKSTL